MDAVRVGEVQRTQCPVRPVVANIGEYCYARGLERAGSHVVPGRLVRVPQNTLPFWQSSALDKTHHDGIPFSSPSWCRLFDQTVSLVHDKGKDCRIRHYTSTPNLLSGRRSQGKGWHEQDPLELYRSVKIVVQAVGDEVKVHHGSIDLSKHQLAAIGITNPRETVIAWNRTTGIPYYKAIVWE